MKCIICTDITCCKPLEEFVRKSSVLNIGGTYNDSASIRQQLSKGKDTDLFIVDIDIPELDLFNFIKYLNNTPKIILISGNVQDAVKAFDSNAVDYILKPVTYSRFIRAVDKALKFLPKKESKHVVENEIFIKKGSTLVKLRLTDLVYIEALENYITLNTKDEKFTIHFTMKAFEEQLASGVFIRVHRSFIVNKSTIQAVKEDSLDLVLGDKVKNIPIGNSYREAIMQHLDIITR
jgi:DNA-binding LytR/AlgR family response regulator